MLMLTRETYGVAIVAARQDVRPAWEIRQYAAGCLQVFRVALHICGRLRNR